MLVCLASPWARAAADPATELAQLQQEYAELKQWTQTKLGELEQRIQAMHTAGTRSAANTTATARPAEAAIDLHGDLRLRYEFNDGGGQPDRSRGALRGRIAATAQLGSGWQIGARLTTGDPDDPNSSDVTLGDFGDDLTASLDRAYVRYSGNVTTLWAGRFANPFTTTDLVWDGDVNLAGAAVDWHTHRHANWQAGITTAFAIVDEQAAGSDSTLFGLQSHLDLTPSPAWRLSLNVAYYEYSIGSLANADAGDIRDNRLLNGGYLSDFRLLDSVAHLTVAAQTRWPLTLTGNVVRNLGASDEDSGYRVGLSAGQLRDAGDFSLGYAYSAVQSDAVFAAYAQDNIAFGSNYRQHELWLKYRVSEVMDLNLTGYRYRQQRATAGTPSSSRVRLNWAFRF